MNFKRQNERKTHRTNNTNEKRGKNGKKPTHEKGQRREGETVVLR